MEKNPKKNKIEEILADEKTITQALKEGVQAALKRHKQANKSIVCWENGKIVELKPEEIPDFNE